MRCSPNNSSNSEQIRRKFSVSSAAFKDNLTSFWFLLPIVVIFIVLTLIPLTQSIFYSFTDFNGYDLNFHFIGLQKYQQVFSDTSLLSALIFTLMYSFIVTIVVTCLAIPLAVVLNQAMIGKSFFAIIVLLPRSTSTSSNWLNLAIYFFSFRFWSRQSSFTHIWLTFYSMAFSR